MSSAIDLVILNGPLEGEIVQLQPKGRIVLGRATGTVQIPDRLVSMKHAEITFAGDSYWIEDIGSATGTWVDDKRVNDRAAALRPGTRVRLGETDLEVRERPRSTGLRVVGGVAAVVILLLGIRTFIDSIDIDYNPMVRWFEPIQMGAGAATEQLRVPTAFIRETGADHRGIKLLRVTDHDDNGVDEVWVRLSGEERVVTFDVEGNWRTLGVLPVGCRPLTGGAGFPVMECHGTRYRYDGSNYVIEGMDDVVAWMPPTQPVEGDQPEVVDGAPQPFLVSLTRSELLAGFLAFRGVEEPVVYLVCEDALPGLKAQVRTASGSVVPLSRPCLNDIVLEGVNKEKVFGAGQPRAVAFSAHGREALLDDLGMYLAGDPSGLLMDGPRKAVFDAMGTHPSVKGGSLLLSFKGDERLFEPTADEGPIEGPPAPLIDSGGRVTGARPSEVVRIDRPGRHELPGCGPIRVELNEWHCLFAKGCGTTSTFMTITNDSCGTGEPQSISYRAGSHEIKDGRLLGRVVVDSIDEGGQIDVLRARIAYRVSGR